MSKDTCGKKSTRIAIWSILSIILINIIGWFAYGCIVNYEIRIGGFVIGGIIVLGFVCFVGEWVIDKIFDLINWAWDK